MPAMDVDDLWFEDDPDSPGEKRQSPQHGKGSRWQARWRDPAGRQRKQRFARKRDAEQHLAKVAADKAAGSYVDPGAGKVTFEAYAEPWRKSRAHDPATAARIESEFRLHVYENPGKPGRTRSGGIAIGQHQLGMLSRSPSVMQQWIKGIPLAASSARLVILDVSQVFKAAVDDVRITKNPLKAPSIQRPTVSRRLAVALTAAQVMAIEAELPDHLSAMAPLGASCGHRKGELFAAEVDDLDFLRKTCHIEWQVKLVAGELYFAPTKNGAVRDVPVGDYAVWAVAAHLKRHPAVEVKLPVMREDGTIGKPVTRKLIFTRPDGQAHWKSSVAWGWTAACKRAGVVLPAYSAGWHVLRHTAASWWLSGGLSLAKAAALLGDTKQVVLDTYAHFMPEDDDLARQITNGQLVPYGDAGDRNVPPAAGGQL